jgi:hypothetical protein
MPISKRYSVQWAAQFFVAAELTRKGYTISFTLGNAPETDLHVSNIDSSIQFRVDVKGHSTKNFWEIKYKKPKEDLFYILVDVFMNPPIYYILHSEEMMKEWKEYHDYIIKFRKEKGRKPPSDNYRWGIRHTQAIKYKDRWDILGKKRGISQVKTD